MLERVERSAIVLLAMLQALLLYVASMGSDEGWWPFSRLGGRVYWYTLVLVVPTVMMLSLQRLADWRYWQQAAGVTAAFAALASWAIWTATAEVRVEASAVLFPFGMAMAVGVLILTPFLQVRIAHGRWCTPYPDLFEHAWQNAITLLLAGLFVGLGWSVMWLGARLFELIGIDMLKNLLKERPVAYLLTGLLFGLGVLIGRTQQRPVKMARAILFALFTGLLPVLSVMTVLFVASLPFTGLDALFAENRQGWWDYGVASVLGGLIAHQVLFLNAVVQDGQGSSPYPRWLRRVVDLGLILLPVLAALAVAALWIRIADRGWTPNRFWAMATLVVLCAYAGGYAWAALRPTGGWLRLLPRVNVAVAVLVLAIVVLGNSPLLDPYRLAANSQLARLQAMDAAAIERDQLEWLRFSAGRPGVAALHKLKASDPAGSEPSAPEATTDDPNATEAATEPTTEAATHLSGRIDALLARNTRYGWRRGAQQDDEGRITEPDEMARHIRVVPEGEAPLPVELLEMLASNGTDWRRLCRTRGESCVALWLDADLDGQAEALVCDVTSGSSIDCVLIEQADGQWAYVQWLSWHGSSAEEVAESIKAGRIEVRAQRWGSIGPGGAHWRSIAPAQ